MTTTAGGTGTTGYLAFGGCPAPGNNGVHIFYNGGTCACGRQMVPMLQIVCEWCREPLQGNARDHVITCPMSPWPAKLAEAREAGASEERQRMRTLIALVRSGLTAMSASGPVTAVLDALADGVAD
jgi:hypothetical protein